LNAGVSLKVPLLASVTTAPPDWHKVGELPLDPGAVPDEALLRGLIGAGRKLAECRLVLPEA
jgi:hypothetical protein